MRITSAFPILFVFSLLTGCLTVYHPTDISKTVTLKGSGYKYLRICDQKKWYVLEKDRDGFIRIPYGRRITISDNHVINTYAGNTTYTTICQPLINFIPKNGNNYFVNYNEDVKSCSLEILRYSNQSSKGMVPEETVKGGIACD